jgi:hypothetical protein
MKLTTTVVSSLVSIAPEKRHRIWLKKLNPSLSSGDNMMPKELEEREKEMWMLQNDGVPLETQWILVAIAMEESYTAGFQAGVTACVAAMPEEICDKDCELGMPCHHCGFNDCLDTALSRLNNLLT